MIAPLEITGLTKVFDTPSGPFVAVKDVNATIRQSEFVCILGHSGCGKSTVLSIVAGLDTATYGGVVIDGNDHVFSVRIGTAASTESLTREIQGALSINPGRPLSQAGS